MQLITLKPKSPEEALKNLSSKLDYQKQVFKEVYLQRYRICWRWNDVVRQSPTHRFSLKLIELFKIPHQSKIKEKKKICKIPTILMDMKRPEAH